MNVDRQKGRRNLRVLLIGLALVGVAVACMCFFVVAALRSFMYAETERYLEEISHHAAQAVDTRMSEDFLALRTAGEVYAHIKQEQGREKGVEYLEMIAADYDFARIGIGNLEGRMVTTDGRMVEAGSLDVIHAALSGKEAASSAEYSPVDGQEAIIYALPLYEEGKLTGVLSASRLEESLRVGLGIESFGGEGFSAVIDGGGNVITENGDRELRGKVDNFFTLLEEEHALDEGYSLDTMRGDMAAGRSGMLYYTLSDGVDKAAAYLPLKSHGWYLLSIVPTYVVGDEIQRFIHMAVAVDAAIVMLFVLLILLFAHLSWRSRRELERVAFVDPVTDGPNRTCFEQDAGALIHAAPPGAYALVSIDIHKFKLINDTFGSEKGNCALRYIFRIFQNGLREGELAARLSADTFNLLLKNESREMLEARLNTISENVNAFNEGREQKYFLPLYHGVYIVEEPGLDMITLQDRATVARKESRHRGENGLSVCTFYDDNYRTQMRREKEIADRMESALEDGEFLVYLQPKVELQRDSVAGAEALVRWRDPHRGLVSPGEFIPVFERNGFIVKLDLFVFEQVCILERKWLDAGRAPVPISVNLSRAHLRNPEFLAPYQRIRKEYHIPDGVIEIEITESMVAENQRAITAVMDLIHEAGFRCSVDDFGSGYSSLNMLQAIHADVLKLDRSFFTEESERGEYVVRSVLSLARRLNMETVCEGVERPQQLEFLRQAQCDMVQGFVYARPMPAAEFEEMAFSGRSVEAIGQEEGAGRPHLKECR